MTDPIARLAEVVATRTNRGRWYLNSFRDEENYTSCGTILSVDAVGNQASGQDVACADALGSCADEIVAVLKAAAHIPRIEQPPGSPIFYRVIPPGLRELEAAYAALAAKLAAVLPEKEVE